MIIVYHQISEHISPKSPADGVSIPALERQLAELSEKHIVELRAYDPQDPDLVAIVFDSGKLDILKALPLLKEKGYPFSVFLTGEHWGKPGYIGADESRMITSAGGSLQWRGMSHRDLGSLSTNELEEELSVPPTIRQNDESGFYALLLPSGQDITKIAPMAKQMGFICCLNTESSATKQSEDGDAMPVWSTVQMDENKSAVPSLPVSYIELAVTTWPCNFRCHYCYVGQNYSELERRQVDEFQYSPAQLAEALSTKRLGGRALLNFCANGETLILPKNVDYVEAMLQAGHYVMVVTNMTQTKAITKLLNLPIEQVSRLFFKCSFHWLELKKRNLLDTFTNNVKLARQRGASITIEITPSDELEAHIPEIIEYSNAHFGALPHITVPRDNHEFSILTNHSQAEFAQIWGVFESGLFDFKMSIWDKRVTSPCYAGVWGYSINIADGEIYRCSSTGRVGNLFPITDSFPHAAPSTQCPFRHCYNGHFWEVFGLVPDIETPSYVVMRDRVCDDGSHWVRSDMRKAFQSRATHIHTPFSPRKLNALLRKEKRTAYWGGVYQKLIKLAINLIPISSWRRNLRKKHLNS